MYHTFVGLLRYVFLVAKFAQLLVEKFGGRSDGANGECVSCGEVEES